MLGFPEKGNDLNMIETDDKVCIMFNNSNGGSMKLNWNYRLKGRAWKTALAVFLTELCSVLLRRSSAFYGSIAAVICLMKTKEETKQKGIARLIGTMLGGGLGWIALEIFVNIPHYKDFVFIFLAPLGILLIIYLLNVLNRQSSCMIGCVVFLSIVVNFNRTLEQIPSYVINRILDTVLGIVMASLVMAIPFEKIIHFKQQSQDK